MEVANKLQEIHNKGYSHNDLHVDNVLVSGNTNTFHIRIIDFGYSHKLDDVKNDVIAGDTKKIFESVYELTIGNIWYKSNVSDSVLSEAITHMKFLWQDVAMVNDDDTDNGWETA